MNNNNKKTILDTLEKLGISSEEVFLASDSEIIKLRMALVGFSNTINFLSEDMKNKLIVDSIKTNRKTIIAFVTSILSTVNLMDKTLVEFEKMVDKKIEEYNLNNANEPILTDKKNN